MLFTISHVMGCLELSLLPYCQHIDNSRLDPGSGLRLPASVHSVLNIAFLVGPVISLALQQ